MLQTKLNGFPNVELTGILAEPFKYTLSDGRAKYTPSHVYVFSNSLHPFYVRIIGIESSGTGTGRSDYVSGTTGAQDSCYYLQPNVNYLLQNCALKHQFFNMVQLEISIDGPAPCNIMWSPDVVRRELVKYEILTQDDLRPWPSAVQLDRSCEKYELVKSQIALSTSPLYSKLNQSNLKSSAMKKSLEISYNGENKGRLIARAAQALCGKSYLQDGVGPNGYCAIGLLRAALTHAGIRVERVLEGKTCQDLDRIGTKVDVNQLIPGDTLLICRDFCGKTCDIGIVCGECLFVHVDRTAGVRVEQLDDAWVGRLRGARRLWM